MKKITLLIFVFFVCNVVNAQLMFQKTYGASGGESCNSIVPTSDGGFLIAGSASVSVSLSYMYVIKTDSAGNTLWTGLYGTGTFSTYAKSALQTADGGYIICGDKQTSGSTWNIYLVKTDTSGNILWAKTYDGLGSATSSNIQQTFDGGFIISGDTKYVFGPYSAYLLKIDSAGNILWNKTFMGGYSGDHCYAEQTSEGGFILAARIWDSTTVYVKDVLLVKTNANGDTLWTKTFGGADWEENFIVRQTTDGGYIIAGRTYSYGAGITDVFLTKTDSIGNPLWTKTYGSSGTEIATDVKQTSDSGFIIAAWLNPGINFSNDYYLIKTDNSGDTLWTRTFGGTGSDIAYSVLQASDGGYFVAGISGSFSPGNHDIYIVKTDAGGNSGCNQSALVAEVTSPVMPITNLPCFISSGGSVSADVAIPGTIGTETVICHIGINETVHGDNIVFLFPNPTFNELIIDNGELKIEKVEIYNMLGERIHSQVSNLKSQISIDVSQLPSGIYFVKVKTEKEERVGKFVKE